MEKHLEKKIQKFSSLVEKQITKSESKVFKELSRLLKDANLQNDQNFTYISLGIQSITQNKYYHLNSIESLQVQVQRYIQDANSNPQNAQRIQKIAVPHIKILQNTAKIRNCLKYENPFTLEDLKLIPETFPSLTKAYTRLKKEIETEKKEISTDESTEQKQEEKKPQETRSYFIEDHLVSQNDAYFLYAYRQFRKLSDQTEIDRILTKYNLDPKKMEIRAHSILVELGKYKKDGTTQVSQLQQTSQESKKNWEDYEKLREEDIQRKIREVQQMLLDKKIKREQIEDTREIEKKGVRGLVFGTKKEQETRERQKKTEPEHPSEFQAQERLQKLYRSNTLDSVFLRRKLSKEDIQELQRLEKKFGKYKSKDKRAVEHFAYQAAERIAFTHLKKGYNAVKQKGTNLIDRTQDRIDKKLKGKDSSLAKKLRQANNFLLNQRKRKDKSTNLFGAAWELGKAVVNKVVQPIVKAVRTVGDIAKKLPVIKQVSTAVTNTSNWLNNASSAIKSNRLIQGVVKGVNTFGDAIKTGASFAKGGLQTGAIWGGATALASIANPAIAPFIPWIAGGGVVVGGIRENLNQLSKVDISNFAKLRFITPTNQARFFLSNPFNVGKTLTPELVDTMQKLSEFQNPEILNQLVPGNTITAEMSKQVRILGLNPRTYTNALNSLDTVFVVSSIATLFGLNPIAATVVGAAAGAGHFALRQTMDYALRKANERLLAFLQFPAGSVVNIYQGSQSAMRLLNELAPEQVSMANVSTATAILPKSIQTVLDIASTIGIGTGTYGLTDWVIRSVAGVGRNVPFFARIAPVAAPIAYIVTGLLGLHTITLAGLLTASLLGFAAWGVGALVTWVTGANPIVGYAAGAATYTALEFSMGRKIEAFFDKIFDTVPSAAINGIANLLNAYNLVKSIMDLIYGKINSLADYFKAFSIAMGLITGMYLLSNYMEGSSQAYQEIQNPTSPAGAIYYQQDIKSDYYAQGYTIPTQQIEIDCANRNTQELKIDLDVNIKIEDTCRLQKDGKIYQNIKASYDDQLFIIENLPEDNLDQKFWMHDQVALYNILKHCG